jgi:hypothetical protein
MGQSSVNGRLPIARLDYWQVGGGLFRQICARLMRGDYLFPAEI